MSTALEFVGQVNHGHIHGTSEFLHQLNDEAHANNVEISSTPEYVYAVRVAISRNDDQMCELLTSVLDKGHVFDAGTVLAASCKSLRVFTAIVGAGGHGLNNVELFKNHPLVLAASVGNTKVASFIIDWIRAGGTNFIPKMNELKHEALVTAASVSSVSICKLLITNAPHVNLAVVTMIRAGHTDSVIRLLHNTDLDFAADNFELLKLAAPYPGLLKQVMRHPSLKKYHYDMPTVYSQFAMTDAMDTHEGNMENLIDKFRDEVTLHARAAIKASGCPRKTALTAAYAKLKPKYNAISAPYVM
jgi:hypothetical protein